MTKNASYKRFTDEEIHKADNTNIIDYIRSIGLETKKAGKTIKLEGYGGLYIDPIENKWNCFSEREGGGPIQLVMYLENKSWKDAMKVLLGNDYNIQSTHSTSPYKTDIKKEKKATEEFKLPPTNTTYKHMITYLTKTRGIDLGVVQKLIDNKMLYEDDKRNCIFVGYDKNNTAKYANIRGTNTNRVFKGEVKGSQKGFSFNISGNLNSDKLYVFESPIEAMSYITIAKLKFGKDLEFKHNMLSLGGSTDIALEQYLKDNQNIKEICLCLNNDQAGIKATGYIKRKYEKNYKIEVKLPQLEDYNDLLDLCQYIGHKIKFFRVLPTIGSKKIIVMGFPPKNNKLKTR